MKKVLISILLIEIIIGGFGIRQITKTSERELVSDEKPKNKSSEGNIKVSENIDETTEKSEIEITTDDKNQETSNSKSQNNSNINTSKPKQEKTQSTLKAEEQQVIQEQPIKQETQEQDQLKQEEQKLSYIGVPDPNDLDYPVHHGVIQYKTYEECYNAGIELSFSDSSVKSFWSYPVRDSRATVLGYYLYVERY